MTEPSASPARARLARVLPLLPAVVLFATAMLVARSFAPAAGSGPGGSPAAGGTGATGGPAAPPSGPYTGPPLAGVFVNCSPACDLIAASPGAGLRLTFTDRAVDESAPTLSPDGDAVAFRCGAPAVEAGGAESPRPRGPGSICRISTTPPGSESATPFPVTTLLSDPHVDYGAPAWSPDGSTLAFAFRSAAGESGIGLWDLVGSVATTVTEPGMEAANPAWSPDGSTLAFGCGTVAGPEGAPEARFCVMPRTGGMVTALGAVSGDCGAPTFTPDAAQLAVVCVGPGTAGGDLFYLALSEPMSRSITRDQLMAPEGKRRLVFSPDGRFVYVRRDDALWAIELATEMWSLPPLPPLHGDFDVRVIQ